MMIDNETKTGMEWNRVGNVYFAEGEWHKAVLAYQTAIQHAAHLLDSYYNLALAYTKLGRVTEAQQALNALLAIMPDHLPAHFQIALLLMRQNNFQSAIPHLLIIYQKELHFETFVNLATCYLRLGNLSQATTYYLEAHNLVPTDKQVLFNLGVINAQQGRLKQALQFYLHLIKQPFTTDEINTKFATHNNLATTYLALKDKAAALLHFRIAMQIQPDNAALQHIITALEGYKNIHSTPIPYVRSLFNSYANYYEAHLNNDLAYQIPNLMIEILRSYLTSANSMKILDLGCGTGLMGSLLAPYAKWMIGVDIAEAMLQIAAKKHLYDELIHEDILTFLHKNTLNQLYDLIITADVLPYFGELDSFILAVTKLLNSSGLFIFTIEKATHSSQLTDNYQLSVTGRFTHTHFYIEGILNKVELSILHRSEVILRTEDHLPVNGYLYLVQLVR